MPAQRGRGKQGNNFAAQPTSRFGSCVSSSLANRGNVSLDTQKEVSFPTHFEVPGFN